MWYGAVSNFRETKIIIPTFLHVLAIINHASVSLESSQPSLCCEMDNLHVCITSTVILPVGNAAAVLTTAVAAHWRSALCQGRPNALQEWFNLLMSLLFIYGDSLLIATLLVSEKHKNIVCLIKQIVLSPLLGILSAFPKTSCNKLSSQGCPNI